VLPCLDEARTLAACLRTVRQTLESLDAQSEIIVVDNGSQDGSQSVALAEGAILVEAPSKGYGKALKHGIAASRARYILQGDSDGSYDFTAIPLFLAELERGFDLVVGNRFQGGILEGAMPPLHRYFGNPLLSALGRLLFTRTIGDFHCGIRAFRREAILGLDLQCDGMEFASEMIAKAATHGLSLTEIPVTLSPDGRDRRPHLNTWRDGWRHLRFLLSYGLQHHLQGLVGRGSKSA